MMMRKHLVAAVIAIAASAPVSAQSLSRAELLDGCSLMANLAEHIMGARQRRAPLTKALEVASRISAEQGIPWEPLKDLTLHAYERPVGNSELERQQAIGDFADYAMLDCMNTLN
ncbi:MAG: hypothetical protein CVT82_04185 [Alphaproteobacteria bacterium HGW-Alphaproteobacteria-4]|nr:MAG: hypothetical protein CVT82_04185 [Alphaproteobacteria bacterium HGW-Alphaproteobacteria-4]